MSNWLIFLLSEIFLLLLVVRAMFYRASAKLLRLNSGKSVTRGNVSWEFFTIAFTVLSLFYNEIATAAEEISEFRSLLILANMLFCFYLCFKSAWFRNKIVGVLGKIRDSKEDH